MADDKHRQYYSARNGRPGTAGRLEIKDLRRLVFLVLDPFVNDNSHYLVETFGTEFWDGSLFPGSQDRSFGALLFLRTGHDLWPLNTNGYRADASALYDLIEFVCEHISEPVISSGSGRDRYALGFEKEPARARLRDEINPILSRASPPVELRESGEIHVISDEGFSTLIDAPTPAEATQTIRERLASARKAFGAARDDDTLRHAVLDLAGVYEEVKKSGRLALTKKDAKDLGDILNNYGIRHQNKAQRPEQLSGAELRWTFYVLLAAIHYSLDSFPEATSAPVEAPLPTATVDDIDIPF